MIETSFFPCTIRLNLKHSAMPFSIRQQQRLAFEKGILEDYFPSDHLRWIDPTAAEGEAEVEVDVLTNNDKEYSLRISIPNDFPNGCPSLIVSKPTTPLLKTNGEVHGRSR